MSGLGTKQELLWKMLFGASEVDGDYIDKVVIEFSFNGKKFLNKVFLGDGK